MTRHYCDKCKREVPPPQYCLQPDPATSYEVTLPVWDKRTLLSAEGAETARAQRDFKRVLLCLTCLDELRRFLAD